MIFILTLIFYGKEGNQDRSHGKRKKTENDSEVLTSHRPWLPVSYQPQSGGPPVKTQRRKTAAAKGKAETASSHGVHHQSPPLLLLLPPPPRPLRPPADLVRWSGVLCPARIQRRLLRECGEFVGEPLWVASRASIRAPTGSCSTPSRAAEAAEMARADGLRPRHRPPASAPARRDPWSRRASRSSPQVRASLRSAFWSIDGSRIGSVDGLMLSVNLFSPFPPPARRHGGPEWRGRDARLQDL